MPEYLEGPNYIEFKSKLKLFTERYLTEYPLYSEINKEIKSIVPISGCENIIQHLQTIKSDELFFSQFKKKSINCEKMVIDKDIEQERRDEMSKPRVFIVYGHDTDSLNEVELFLRRIECEPVILKNEPSGGLTIIEKIEQYVKDIEFAIVLYTACDEGRLCGENKELVKRARQNVVFEHGFLISRITRERVVALVEDGVETPGDVNGVIYTSMSEDDWRQKIMKEMKNIGVSIKNEIDVGTGAIKKIDASSGPVWEHF